MGRKLKDETGKVYGRLTVVNRADNHGQYAAWNVVCECGNTAVVRGSYLHRGSTRSCGCLQAEAARVSIIKAQQSRQARPQQLVYDHPRRKVGRPKKPLDVDRVIALYNEGLSYRKIQAIVPVSLRTLSAMINANLDKLTREQYKGGR